MIHMYGNFEGFALLEIVCSLQTSLALAVLMAAFAVFHEFCCGKMGKLQEWSIFFYFQTC